ncbi:MAG: hypothetical protein KIT09_07135 [Bryobacteraceae bacterium]|nr:hypothetical protein [Bryobacteraceae bacterium]
MIQTIGVTAILLLLGLLLFNGIVMLLSPSTWLLLPTFISFPGRLRRKSLDARGMSLQIRILGVTQTGVIGYVAFRVLADVLVTLVRDLPKSDVTYTALLMTSAFAAGAAALVMLLRPRWWIEKYIAYRSPYWNATSKRVLTFATRLISLVVLVPAVYMLSSIILAVGWNVDPEAMTSPLTSRTGFMEWEQGTWRFLLNAGQVFAALLSVAGLFGGLALALAPRKAVRVYARYQWPMTEESISHPVMLWRYRIIGLLITATCIFMLGIVLAPLMRAHV